MVKDWLSLSWQVMVVRGIVGVVFGVVAMAWPIGTVVALVVLWAVWALLDGIGAFAQAFGQGVTWGARILLIVLGVIGLAAALMGFFRPGVTAVALTWILGIWLIVRGVFEVIGAFVAQTGTSRWLLVLSGLLDVLLGALFAANPGRSAVTVAFVLGLVALVWGVVLVVTGLVARSQLKNAGAPPVGGDPVTT